MVGLEGLPSKSTESDKKKNTVSADRVGNTRIPVAIVDGIVHPDPAPLHQIPQLPDEEIVLSRVESLVGKGHYGAAIKESKSLNSHVNTLMLSPCKLIMLVFHECFLL